MSVNEYIENHVMEQVFTKYSSETWLEIIPDVQMSFFKDVWMNPDNEHMTHKIVLGVEVTDWNDPEYTYNGEYYEISYPKKNKEIFCVGEEEAKRCLDICERIFGGECSYTLEKIREMPVMVPVNFDMRNTGNFQYVTYYGFQHNNRFITMRDKNKTDFVHGQYSCLYNGAIAYLITGFHSDIPSAQRFLYNGGR